MTNLTHHSVIAQLLAEHGLQPDKRFGQNFLVDESVIAASLAAAAVQRTDTVLEIGPGLGVLTRELIARAGTVHAIEYDERLQPVLARTLGSPTNLHLHWQDALTFPFATLPRGTKLVANLPYNVATTLLIELLESQRFASLTALVQLEVAERLMAEPSTKAYGALSLIRLMYASGRIVKRVPPGAFFPPPKVTSAVIHLVPETHPEATEAVKRVIQHGFRHRRKTLQKNLLMAGYERDAVLTALADLPPQVRAEELTLQNFIDIAKRL